MVKNTRGIVWKYLSLYTNIEGMYHISSGCHTKPIHFITHAPFLITKSHQTNPFHYPHALFTKILTESISLSLQRRWEFDSHLIDFIISTTVLRVQIFVLMVSCSLVRGFSREPVGLTTKMVRIHQSFSCNVPNVIKNCNFLQV